jgi:hypothetical protein
MTTALSRRSVNWPLTPSITTESPKEGVHQLRAVIFVLEPTSVSLSSDFSMTDPRPIDTLGTYSRAFQHHVVLDVDWIDDGSNRRRSSAAARGLYRASRGTSRSRRVDLPRVVPALDVDHADLRALSIMYWKASVR